MINNVYSVIIWLSRTFVGHGKTMTFRANENPEMFSATSWRYNKRKQDRERVTKIYTEFVNKFSWNFSRDVCLGLEILFMMIIFSFQLFPCYMAQMKELHGAFVTEVRYQKWLL